MSLRNYHRFQPCLINNHLSRIPRDNYNLVRICARFFCVFRLLIHSQTTRQLLDHKKIIIYTKENECHQRKNNKFVAPIGSLDKNQNHHNKGPYPHKRSHFFSISTKSKQPMMEVGIITCKWTFFHNKHSPDSDPYRIKNDQ